MFIVQTRDRPIEAPVSVPVARTRMQVTMDLDQPTDGASRFGTVDDAARLEWHVVRSYSDHRSSVDGLVEGRTMIAVCGKVVEDHGNPWSPKMHETATSPWSADTRCRDCFTKTGSVRLRKR